MKNFNKLAVLLLTLMALCSTALLGCVQTEHVHNYSFTVLKEATCDDAGINYGICSCGETVQKEIPAFGHREVVDNAVAPTCTQSGLTEGKHCSLCDEVLLAQEVVPVLAHNYVDGVCGNCGAKDDEYHVHTWQEATCETAKTCLTCGVTEGEALGHKEVVDIFFFIKLHFHKIISLFLLYNKSHF